MLSDMQTEAVRRLFSVEEYDLMVEAGILTKEDRVELIEGEILEMSPIGNRHGAGVDRANMLFAPLLKGRAIVRVQGAVRLSDYTKAQPDILLLNHRQDYYAFAAPVTEDALLVIEVADTSIRYDRGPKPAIYAKHGVREVWIEDLTTDTLLVFRDRQPGGYATALTFKAGDSVSPLAFPDLVLSFSDLFGS